MSDSMMGSGAGGNMMGGGAGGNQMGPGGSSGVHGSQGGGGFNINIPKPDPGNLANFNWTPFAGMPAAQAPPGQVANLVNPPRYNAAPIAVGTLTLVLALFFLGCRLYARLFIVRSMQWDDAACLLGFCGFLTCFVATMLSNTLGNGGYHSWDITFGAIMSDPNYIYSDVYVFGSLIASTFIKLSFYIMYWNIFGRLKWMRWTLIVVGGLTTAANIALNLVVFITYTAPPGTGWFHHIITATPLAGLLSGGNVSSAISNLISDVAIFVIPIPAVYGLQMPMRRRLGVAAIFFVGILACIASAMSLYYRIINLVTADVSYWWSWVYTLSLVEYCVGIMCASTPAAVQIFRKARPSAGDQTNFSERMSRTGHATQQRSQAPATTSTIKGRHVLGGLNSMVNASGTPATSPDAVHEAMDDKIVAITTVTTEGSSDKDAINGKGDADSESSSYGSGPKSEAGIGGTL